MAEQQKREITLMKGNEAIAVVWMVSLAIRLLHRVKL